jgi:hypothetical protein
MEHFMSFGRKNIILGISGFVAAAMAGVPMATGFAFETDASALAEADDELLAVSGLEQEEAILEGGRDCRYRRNGCRL